MFMLAVDTTYDDSYAAPVGVCKPAPRKVEDRKGRYKTVSNKEKEDLRLVECILLIRDAQDKAAFAEVFRRFAPRVKAYLIKSGSDGTIAEECAQDVMATLWHSILYGSSR